MTTRARTWAFAAACTLAAGFGPALAAPAGAQNSARLDLVSQTLVIGDDPAEIVVRVLDAPDDARLQFTVYSTPARTRDAVQAQHETPPSGGGRIAQFECTLDGDCLDQAMMTIADDGALTVTLDDTEIGEILRARPGVLPFVVRLVDDGRRLDTLATSLIVPDPEFESDAMVRIAFLHEIAVPIARQADLNVQVDGAAVIEAAAFLAAHPELPVTSDIRPETLDALEAVDPETLATLVGLIDERPLLRGPWVEMDEEAWRIADESDQVVSQYARGNDTIERLVGAPPTGIIRLDLDARPETLTLLRSAGVTTVVVADSQLRSTTTDIDPDQPFQLLDANGVAITALRFDDALHATLDHVDEELAAVHAMAELIALANSATTDLGVLLDADSIDPAVLELVLTEVAGLDDVAIADVTELAEGELAHSIGENLRGELEPSEPDDVSALAADLHEGFVGLTTVALMVEPEVDQLVPFVDQLQAAVSAELSSASAEAYVARVAQEIEERRAGVEILDGDRITLTDRRTDLPLTIVNRQSVPLNVELVLTAEKLRFPDGDRMSIILDPGETHVTIPVETLASGDARVSATVVSPGGHFELSAGSVDIRSTAISGLGLIISVIALIVLGAWWIRTIVRVRRNRGAATVSPATEGEA